METVGYISGQGIASWEKYRLCIFKHPAMSFKEVLLESYKLSAELSAELMGTFLLIYLFCI